MQATVLVDNIGQAEMPGEWGLSIYIEMNGQRLLLDTGASALFLANAAALGLDIADVDYGVLSHAHYDHADGMADFFQHNQKAKFYLRRQAEANCYKIAEDNAQEYKYIGIRPDILQNFASRLQPVDGVYQLLDNVYLLPHTTPGLAAEGQQAKMYRQQTDGTWQPDDFAHEQSLVFNRPDGLVVFNSCSHAGVLNIIQEVSQQLNRPVHMLIGGFHLYQRSGEEVQALAAQLRQLGLQAIYTGHCTGQPAFDILRWELGGIVQQLQVGLQIEF